VIGHAGFVEISAVEGLQLTDAMKRRGEDKRVKGVSPREISSHNYSPHSQGLSALHV